MKTAQEFLEEKGVPFTWLGDHSTQGVSVTDLMQEYADYVKLNLPVVSIEFKEKIKKDINELENRLKELYGQHQYRNDRNDDWGLEENTVSTKLKALKTALNYC